LPRTTDWRSPESVRDLKDLDRSALAWEFLRRNPEYRAHYANIIERIASGAIPDDDALTELSRRWGCLFLRDPDLAANEHPLIWRPELLPLGVTLVAAPDCFDEARQLAADELSAPTADLQGIDGRHLVIDDPQGEHRLWLPHLKAGDRLAGLIPLDDMFVLRVAGLTRFHHHLLGASSGPLPALWKMTRRYRQRLSLMVRALDGHLSSASYREIADALYGPEAITRYAWKTSSIRGQTCLRALHSSPAAQRSPRRARNISSLIRRTTLRTC
jgi:hypothetical protein